MRDAKDQLYEQVARLGKAMAHPKRLELIELLCQGEKTVETLAAQSDISVQLASAHLKTLRQARLVDARKEGKYVLYRLSGTSVADLWVALRAEAEARLVELQRALVHVVAHGQELEGMDRRTLLDRAARGEVVVLDVRPANEFEAAHLLHARSLPLHELKGRLAELPLGVPVVAYCRGPFCLMAKQAVELLRQHGHNATHLTDGVAEWRARGLPLHAAA